MERLRIAIVFLGLCFLWGCNNFSEMKHISNAIGIQVSEEMDFTYEDTHGGFHGDGTTFAKIELDLDHAEFMDARVDAFRCPQCETIIIEKKTN